MAKVIAICLMHCLNQIQQQLYPGKPPGLVITLMLDDLPYQLKIVTTVFHHLCHRVLCL